MSGTITTTWNKDEGTKFSFSEEIDLVDAMVGMSSMIAAIMEAGERSIQATHYTLKPGQTAQKLVDDAYLILACGDKNKIDSYVRARKL